MCLGCVRFAPCSLGANPCLVHLSAMFDPLPGSTLRKIKGTHLMSVCFLLRQSPCGAFLQFLAREKGLAAVIHDSFAIVTPRFIVTFSARDIRAHQVESRVTVPRGLKLDRRSVRPVHHGYIRYIHKRLCSTAVARSNGPVSPPRGRHESNRTTHHAYRTGVARV